MLRVLTVAGALLVIAQLHRASGGVVSIELSQTFGLGAARIGLVIGAMMLASAVLQLPAGLAFDRFGTRRTVSAMALVALLGTLLFAGAGGFAGLAVARFLIGAGFAGAVTGIVLLAMHWAPPERFSTVAATVLASASFVGGVLATTPLALALQAVGWAPTYLIVAALCALAIGLAYAVIRDLPSGVTVRRGGESLADSLRGLRALFGDADLRRIFVMAACAIAPFSCTGGLWAGPYLQDVHGLGREQASYVLLGMVLMLNLGTLGYGPLDRCFGTRRGVVLAGAGASCLLLAALAVVPQPPLWLAVVLLLGLGLTSPFYVTLTAHAPGLRADRARRPPGHHDQPLGAVGRLRRAMELRPAGRPDRRRRGARLGPGLSPGVRLPRLPAARRPAGLSPGAGVFRRPRRTDSPEPGASGGIQIRRRTVSRAARARHKRHQPNGRGTWESASASAVMRLTRSRSAAGYLREAQPGTP